MTVQKTKKTHQCNSVLLSYLNLTDCIENDFVEISSNIGARQ